MNAATQCFKRIRGFLKIATKGFERMRASMNVATKGFDRMGGSMKAATKDFDRVSTHTFVEGFCWYVETRVYIYLTAQLCGWIALASVCLEGFESNTDGNNNTRNNKSRIAGASGEIEGFYEGTY